MRRFITLSALAASFLLTAATSQAAIIKLGYSTDSLPDVEAVNGVLSTVQDVSAGTLGDQDTEVTLLSVLSGLLVIEGDRASFTLDGVQFTGNPAVIGGTVLQPTAGGNFNLYDPANALLLSGTLGKGTLSGPLGGTATGGFLTTEFGQFTGGSLLPTLQANNLLLSSVSISLTDVGGGVGFSLAANGSLQDFAADATANISAAPQVPEPQSVALALSGIAATLFGLRRRS